jgi:YfiR/HmsC-like
MRARLRPWILGVLFVASVVPGRAAPTAEEVKAAFIFHFTQFVAWPAQCFDGPDAPFVIGVLGDGTIDQALTLMVQGERLGHHPIEVRHLRNPADAADCQIVYVAGDSNSLFRAARLRDAPVLTVGESDAFLDAGGMIEFFTERSRVRLRINLPAARSASLQISSKLLRVAQVLPSS